MRLSARPVSLMCAWAGGALFVVSLAYFLYCYLVRFGRATAGGSGRLAVAIDVALFSVFALHHSALARAGAKAFVGRVVSPALERSVYTWVSSLLFILTCGLWRPVPGELYNLDGFAAMAFYLVQLAGFLLTIRASAALDPLDLAGIRSALDAGRRHEDAGGTPRHVPLKTTGLYAFVRHPLYFAWLIFVFGTPHMTYTRLVFASVSCLYLAIAIPFEERSLLKLFGSDYEAYRRNTPWRMIPGLY